jgi:murein DD-endopeptidase MepM/ murein hydrolase activator NlpD
MMFTLQMFLKMHTPSKVFFSLVIATASVALLQSSAQAQALFCSPTTKNPLKGFIEPTGGVGPLTSAHTGDYLYADDVAAPMGTPVKMMRAGTVVYTQDGFPDTGGGASNFQRTNLVNVRYDDGPDCGSIQGDRKYYSLYLHLKKGSVRVKKGDRISAGTVIGEVGNSGWSTGAHLHVEVNLSTGPRWWDRKTVPYIWTSGRNK